MSSLVLYAIVGDAPSRDALGALRVVRAGGARVVVGSGAAAAPTADALKRYDRVIRRIARASSAVLPFRFGSTVTDRAALAALLDPLAPAIARALDLVAGATQFTLRVYGAPAKPAKARAGEGPGTRFLADRLRRHQVPEIASVTTATRPFVRATRVERHDRPPLLASVYHLVSRADARRYRGELERATRDLRDVRVEMTGPWPCYAFAEIP